MSFRSKISKLSALLEKLREIISLNISNAHMTGTSNPQHSGIYREAATRPLNVMTLTFTISSAEFCHHKITLKI